MRKNLRPPLLLLADNKNKTFEWTRMQYRMLASRLSVTFSVYSILMNSCRDCVREKRSNAQLELTESLQNAQRGSASNMNTQRNGLAWVGVVVVVAAVVLNNNCINFRLTEWRRIAAFLLMKQKIGAKYCEYEIQNRHLNDLNTMNSKTALKIESNLWFCFVFLR